MTDNFDHLPRLNDAIGQVSKETLVSILENVCQNYPSARDFVQSQLFVNKDEVSQPGAPASSDAPGRDTEGGSNKDTSATAKTPPKRLRERYAVCTNCEKEFDVAANTQTSCCYHPEESEPNEEEFLDHDEDCHGPIDCDEMREQYPESFYFMCCDAKSNEKGCVTDWHREREYEGDVSKRRKF